MNINLLRSKMALRGDFNESDLCEVLGIAPMSVHKRMIGEILFKPPEIKAIATKYDLSDSEVAEIFDIGAEKEEADETV